MSNFFIEHLQMAASENETICVIELYIVQSL